MIQPARRPTPPPGVIEPARRATPPPGVIEPARKRTPPPGVIEPARKPTPPPGRSSPRASGRRRRARSSRRASRRRRAPEPAPSFEDAELDLGPPSPRASHPGKPKLDQDVVRLGDPLVTDAGAGITDAALTGVGAARRTPARARPAPVLAVDEEALRKERTRGATVAPGEDDAPEPPVPNWFLRVIVLLVALLAVALAYQFVVRPLLK
ncbi:MAG: hypothetical protein M5U28_01200 [Sandaracinaceae bacterium]|nr:hypothetical protein [Sandaracinaceae bacterium]